MTRWTRICSSAILLALTACDTGSRNTGNAQPGAAQSDANGEIGNAKPAADNTDVAEPVEMAPAVAAAAPVVAETLPYAEVDEKLVYGHFVFPADMVDPLPGLIVIHEWWGLNDDIRAMADRIAAQGYIVLAIDLFGGQSSRLPADARAMMIGVVENPELANENIRQAYEFLIESGQSPTIGALGWDFGGGWSLNAAILMPDDLDAAVIYYGQITDDEARLAPLNVPLLGLFGENDRGIPVATVREFEQALERLDKIAEIVIFPGADHSFANPSAANYDAAVADQAWIQTIEFLDRHLLVTAD